MYLVIGPECHVLDYDWSRMISCNRRVDEEWNNLVEQKVKFRKYKEIKNLNTNSRECLSNVYSC